MKLFATGLLVFAAVVFVLARTFEEEATWVGYLESAAEAAMVGALADWFAVTALFRYPLGIPIPHTAIIPQAARTTSAAASATSCRATSSRPTSSASGSHGAQIAERLGGWLAQPANAERAGEATADALGGVVEVLDDRDVQEALGSAVEKRLARTEVAPLLGKAIDVAVEGGHHQRMLDGVMRGLVSFLDDNRTMLRDRLDQESPWWVPEAIDDRVFKKLFTGVERFLADVSATPNHEVRHSLDQRIRALAVKLREDPELIAKCESMKLEVLEHPDVQVGCSRCGARSRSRCSRRPTIRRATCAGDSSTASPQPDVASASIASCRPRSTDGSRAWCCTSPSTTGARSPS